MTTAKKFDMTKTVRRAKQLRNEEHGWQEIADIMDKEGFITQSGISMNMVAINKYVINSTGGNRFRSKKTYTKGTKLEPTGKVQGFCKVKKQGELKTKIRPMEKINYKFNKKEKGAEAKIILKEITDEALRR